MKTPDNFLTPPESQSKTNTDELNVIIDGEWKEQNISSSNLDKIVYEDRNHTS